MYVYIYNVNVPFPCYLVYMCCIYSEISPVICIPKCKLHIICYNYYDCLKCVECVESY